MSALTAAQAIARARMQQPGIFIPLDANLSLTREEFQRQEAALVYGHLAPKRG